MHARTLAALALPALLACTKDAPAPAAGPAPAEEKAGAAEAMDDYARRSKATEARLNLDKIARAAAMYYETPHADRTGAMQPCSFPETTPFTPPYDACKDPAKRYSGGTKAWDTPTWRALHFELTDPHYYRYRIEATGTGAEATLTATAAADLDCDGVWSTFTRVVKAEPGGECASTSGPVLAVDELE